MEKLFLMKLCIKVSNLNPSLLDQITVICCQCNKFSVEEVLFNFNGVGGTSEECKLFAVGVSR